MQVWLNGRLVNAQDAKISVFDRGFLFGDGVYEVVRFFGGGPVGMDLHIARLNRSLALTRIEGFDATQLQSISTALIEKNGWPNASIYLQVSRGAAPTRTHMPPKGLVPTVFACASECGGIEDLEAPTTAACAVVQDERWHRCEIKTTALLGNVLPMLAVASSGSEEAILVRGGFVSEGTTSNVFAVVRGQLVTPPVDTTPEILNGVMRTRLLEACVYAGIPCSVRPICEEDLRGASEIILTASRRMFSAVTSLDGHSVGCGMIGPIATRANAALVKLLRRECGLATFVASPSAPILAS
jgi:D-alanine transaminase